MEVEIRVQSPKWFVCGWENLIPAHAYVFGLGVVWVLVSYVMHTFISVSVLAFGAFHV